MIKQMFMSAIVIVMAASCVHEFPEKETSDTLPVSILIKHQQDWTSLDYLLNGTRSIEDVTARYVYRIYRKGNTTNPSYEYVEDRPDTSLEDFTKTFQLPPGDWEIRIWQELINPGREDTYYNHDDFRSISYHKPYEGDSDLRDAFEGQVSVNIDECQELPTDISAEVIMERPFAKYVFIATDFEDFVTETLRRQGHERAQKWSELSLREQEEMLEGYSVVVVYPYFMPAVYNMFTSKVTDSWSGINYEAKIRPLSATEAQIAMDHVMVNHADTGCQVQLALRSPDGKLTVMTGTVTVPIKRSQVTYVRSKLLTNNVGSGLNIDFDFSGDINIEI